VRAYAHVMIHSAAVWDVLGAFGVLPAWWPPVGYVLVAAGVTAACLGVLLHILTAPRAARSVARTAGTLLVIGILLGTWLLRGDAEIEPDPPLVVAEAAAAALYAALPLLRRRRTIVPEGASLPE
jgi:hypothetical protein